MKKMENNISRRDFIKMTATAATAAAAAACAGKKVSSTEAMPTGETMGEMTYRLNNKGEKISLLGYGCMRWPTLPGEGDKKGAVDQEMVNRLVDCALEHGVNYFDTAPVYCRGESEAATGIALARHPRESYHIATKMSTQRIFSRDEALKMYHDSFKNLQVDYIDYYLLHSVGGGDGMETFNKRFIDNGMLDFLLKEREAGRIRNLGFSFHGNQAVFDWLLSQHDKYHWDFVQIQMNYVDWTHAREQNSRNVNAEYLYGELESRGIPVVIMEPLLGGRLSSLNDAAAARLQQKSPASSVASWAFRFCGSKSGVMTVLSGMTYMEHLLDNLATFSPLDELDEDEFKMLEEIATQYIKFPLIPCTDCKYCMPCPYGLDIPAIFTQYNKCLNEGEITDDREDPEYRKARRAFLLDLNREIPRSRQAGMCISCHQCVEKCPQRIDIPKQMSRIDRHVEKLRVNGVETRRKKENTEEKKN